MSILKAGSVVSLSLNCINTKNLYSVQSKKANSASCKSFGKSSVGRIGIRYGGGGRRLMVVFGDKKMVCALLPPKKEKHCSSWETDAGSSNIVAKLNQGLSTTIPKRFLPTLSFHLNTFWFIDPVYRHNKDFYRGLDHVYLLLATFRVILLSSSGKVD